MRDILANLMQVALIAICSVLATWALANPMDVKAIDGNEPENTPSYDSAVHRQAAAMVCKVETGNSRIVRSEGTVVAAHVMVVRLNGVMERMDTSEAWDRTKSKTKADDVWVIGICKADIQNQGVKI